MKVCFGLILDYNIHNYARKLAFEINNKYNTGFIAAKLPQHVTLGPLFEINNIEQVEDYFDSFAGSISPFEVTLTSIDLKLFDDDKDGTGVLWMDVKESNELRKLHNRMYKDIAGYSWEIDDDGMYQFHSTIALGEQSASVYKKIFNSIKNKKIDYTCRVKELALFCPSDEQNIMGTYITYKILPLGVNTNSV